MKRYPGFVIVWMVHLYEKITSVSYCSVSYCMVCTSVWEDNQC